MIRLQEPQAQKVEDQVAVAVASLNSQPRPPTGYSAHELFHNGRGQWFENLWEATCSPTTFQDRLVLACERVRQKMQRDRAWWAGKAQRARPPATFAVGNYVLVHFSRFPSRHRSKFDPIWPGPFQVDKIEGKEIVVKIQGIVFRVAKKHVKMWLDQ